MKSQEKAASSPEKSKASRWVIAVGLVFVVGMFVASATPFGLAVWLGTPEEELQKMAAHVQQAPLHREAGALAGIFRIPVAPQEMYWREVSMRRPLRSADSADKALWAVLHYDEVGFEALRAPLPEGELANFKVFLPWLLADMEKNMRLKLSGEVEMRKLPSELFASEAVPPNSLGAYLIPSQQSLLLMRFGAAEFLVK